MFIYLVGTEKGRKWPCKKPHTLAEWNQGCQLILWVKSLNGWRREMLLIGNDRVFREFTAKCGKIVGVAHYINNEGDKSLITKPIRITVRKGKTHYPHLSANAIVDIPEGTML